MARSTTSLNEHLLENTALSEVTVTLETTPQSNELILNEVANSNSSSNADSSCMLLPSSSPINPSSSTESKINDSQGKKYSAA